MAGENGETSSNAGYSTYHCLCSQLIIATLGPLNTLPTRERYGDHIAKDYALAPGSVKVNDKAIILKLDDGYEKRYLASCRRCRSNLGYHMDLEQFEGSNGKFGMEGDVLYVLPGSLMETTKMMDGNG
ncbi:hypothetical protein EJ03DRAFT_347077 [Teratosphaeria nubilosa]|uniref:STEEP1 domain-containing protein n=1 Tax=Teratosphaeria nubilosa TaxID=161662 RepID=A0A6G1LPW2_9PEZI|nr:hypothetical protein EJ03DRAFT_347077 [Teratosphaeria nubilosa]